MGGKILGFPIRLFGFSLFWTWLFLVAVSPSPTFGQLFGPAGMAFELPEVGFRIILLLVAAVFSQVLATRTGSIILALTCMVLGPLTTIVLCVDFSSNFVLLAAVLAAFTDVSMFLMWLCYFGYSKIGETALLLVLSYALGSILCLVVSALGYAFAVVFSALAPVVSGVAFVSTVRKDFKGSGESLFASAESQQLRAHEQKNHRMPASLVRMSAALILYAFVFGFFSSRTATSEYVFSSGPLLQAASSIVVAIVIITLLRFPGKGRAVYGIYRSVAVVFAVGLAAFIILPQQASFVAGAFVMIAYLFFEVLSLNDYCNVAKTNDSFLLRSMIVVRLCASAGIFLGWYAGFVITWLNNSEIAPEVLVAVGLVCVVVASTLIFSEGAAADLRDIATSRVVLEVLEDRPNKQELILAFAASNDLSKRETEVCAYLLSGRTPQYIAEKLFIAESTARTHVHKIYVKTNTHDRMNLLDEFEKFCQR